MSEYDKLMESISQKSEATKKSYKTQYNKLFNLTNKPIHETSEKKIIELLDEIENKNNSQALLNISLLVRRLYGLSTKQLEKKREADKKKIFTAVKEKNVELKKSLPTYDDIVEYMNYLWDKSEWTDYIINYLLINFQVRNQDLDFVIVSRKRDASDKTKNYMWLQNTKKKVTYIRNVYKTAVIKTPDGHTGYGQKVDTINDLKFLTAIRRVLGCQKSELDCGVFIPTKSAIAYHIQKATYKQLGETAYFKIIVNHFRNNIDKLKEISANRGTSLSVILTSYDIEVK
tara:strand:+ start:83 stop:943 length:861 start_codon:yes stop_codon:yes gene_type:complete